jgi:hypothetical protein
MERTATVHAYSPDICLGAAVMEAFGKKKEAPKKELTEAAESRNVGNSTATCISGLSIRSRT